ncbi:MAG: hypothetical protein DI544_06590 [Sphingomonas taxi]|uniref:Uncharacterized protein n=1 Tax=Sphingomonas taxi TaxID=1549858 RepID=A0A2W5RD78_9SPHN|nr:MAG: hypothetical protein DI544_06590 [Sphingomonas taxi]
MHSIAAFALLLAATVQTEQPKPVRDAPERSADANSKMICKRFNETGSLVRSYKTCKTKGEWQRERDNIRSGSVANSCRMSGVTGSC